MNVNRADELERLELISKALRDLLAEVGRMRSRITASERMELHGRAATLAHTHAQIHTDVVCRTATRWEDGARVTGE